MVSLVAEVKDGRVSSFSKAGGGAGVAAFLAAADFFSEAVVGRRIGRGLVTVCVGGAVERLVRGR